MYTPGEWIYNKERSVIESVTQWEIEPDEDGEMGIRKQVISCYGVAPVRLK